MEPPDCSDLPSPEPPTQPAHSPPGRNNPEVGTIGDRRALRRARRGPQPPAGAVGPGQQRGSRSAQNRATDRRHTTAAARVLREAPNGACGNADLPPGLLRSRRPGRACFAARRAIDICDTICLWPAVRFLSSSMTNSSTASTGSHKPKAPADPTCSAAALPPYWKPLNSSRPTESCATPIDVSHKILHSSRAPDGSQRRRPPSGSARRHRLGGPWAAGRPATGVRAHPRCCNRGAHGCHVRAGHANDPRHPLRS
jgi:hypothetical protein